MIWFGLFLVVLLLVAGRLRFRDNLKPGLAMLRCDQIAALSRSAVALRAIEIWVHFAFIRAFRVASTKLLALLPIQMRTVEGV